MTDHAARVREAENAVTEAAVGVANDAVWGGAHWEMLREQFAAARAALLTAVARDREGHS